MKEGVQIIQMKSTVTLKWEFYGPHESYVMSSMLRLVGS